MKTITIAVVCHQGLGTSLWIKVQVEKIILKYRIPANVMQVDIGGLIGVNPDIAVGVGYMEEQLQIQAKTIVVVNNILQTEEIENQLLANCFVKPFIE